MRVWKGLLGRYFLSGFSSMVDMIPAPDNAMSKITKTLERVLRGNADANIRFGDLRMLLTHLGFVERIRGDHYIFTRDGVAEILNLQPSGALAKAYQVKQVRGILVGYGLVGENDETVEEDNDG